MVHLLPFILWILFMLLLPIGISCFLYYVVHLMSNINRIAKTLLFTTFWFLAMCCQLIFLAYIGSFWGFAVVKVMLPLFLVAVPFYFWATAYWPGLQADGLPDRRFFIIQITGFLLGLIVGILRVMSDH